MSSTARKPSSPTASTPTSSSSSPRPIPKAGRQGRLAVGGRDRRAPGFRRGRKLKKLGLDAADTSELFFEDVKLPAENLLGTEEGQGFVQLMKQLPQERLIVATHALCDDGARAASSPSTTSRSARPSARRSSSSRTPSSCWPNARPRRPSPRCSSTTASSATSRASSTPPPPRWPNTGRPTCRQDHRPLPAIVRRLWLYGRISDLAHVSRRAGGCASTPAPTRS